MHGPGRSSVRIVLACCLFAIGAAACGAGKQGAAQDLTRLNKTGFISAAAAQSLHAGTSKIAMTMRVKGGSADENFSVTADGAMDFVHRLFEVKARLPAIAEIKGTMHVIVTPDGEYALGPKEMTTAMGGTAGKWMYISKENLGAGPDPTGLSNFTDPASLFDALRSYSSSVSVSGHDTIRGVPTTAYVVILDKEKMFAKLSGEDRAAFQSMPIPQMKVFVSDDSYIRRESMSFSDQGVSFEMTLDLYDYGTPVHISVPKASDVVEISDIPSPDES